MTVRLIGIDIDGTLLDSRHQLPEANGQAIAEAVGQGIEIALVTGRRFEFARPIFEQLSVPLVLMVNNGALIKTRAGDTLSRHLLPRSVAREVLDLTHAHRSRAALMFDRPRDRQVVFERIDWDDPRTRAYVERSQEFVAEMAPLEDALTDDPIQVMFSGSVAPMRAVEAALRAAPVIDRITVLVTEYESRDFSLVDVLCGHCSKGAALEEWATRHGLSRHEVMAIGDNLNDVEMLRYAGCPVIMGNAVDALKVPGWHVTLSNDEAGVAAAIARFALNGSS